MEAIEQQFPTAEMERVMKIQEVILKAMAGQAEVMGGGPRIRTTFEVIVSITLRMRLLFSSM